MMDLKNENDVKGIVRGKGIVSCMFTMSPQGFNLAKRNLSYVEKVALKHTQTTTIPQSKHAP